MTDTPKPESREPFTRCEKCKVLWNNREFSACNVCHPQAAADSFEDALNIMHPQLKPVDCDIRNAARWGYSQGVAHRAVHVQGTHSYRECIEALDEKMKRISALERERDELKCKLDESLELISQMRAQWFGSWAMNKCISMLRGTRFKHPEHEDPFWLQRIGGGK